MTYASTAPADLEACAREPIRVPGSIQPHGVLLLVEEKDLRIVGASENCGAVLGRPPAALRDHPLADYAEIPGLRAALDSGLTPLPSPLPCAIGQQRFEAILHRNDGLLVVELERATEAFDPGAFYRELQAAITALEAADGLTELLQGAARAVARLTGFDRVMVYRFDGDWNGQVLAESLQPGADSYLGHHFPASDIPPQARELYRLNRVRLIPVSSYRPALLDPPFHPGNGGPLDLSHAVLRSVSPIHLEYLRNMGVQASMSVSILRDGQLWGLIACHHSQERRLPYSVRAACGLFAQVLSSHILRQEELAGSGAMLEARRIQGDFFQHFSQEEDFELALVKYTPRLLEMVEAGGAALCLGERIVLLGRTPTEPEVRELWEWLKSQPNDQPLATDRLARLHPSAAAYERMASGLLAFSISRLKSDYVLWFRPEVVETVTWAGNPDKAMLAQGGRINPRKSFAAWQQTVTGRARPWRTTDLQAARELRTAIGALILRRTEHLLRLNATLEAKNTELNSFAYLSSHDLQEPLRGLQNYSRFLLEDYSDRLDEPGREKLRTLADLARQMHELIEAVAHFTKVGRMEVQARETDLDRVVSDIRVARTETLAGVDFRYPRPLPAAQADPSLIREVIANLVSNAVKYNDRASKWVEVGYEDAPGEPRRFYVRDNGIGIRPRHQDRVFGLFRRLHPQERYGGGTGVGLAVVKAIVERHGGRVWFASEPGQGTTFYFTLSAALPA